MVLSGHSHIPFQDLERDQLRSPWLPLRVPQASVIPNIPACPNPCHIPALPGIISPIPRSHRGRSRPFPLHDLSRGCFPGMSGDSQSCATPSGWERLGALCSQIPRIPSLELARAWSSLLPNPTDSQSGIAPFAPCHQIQQDPEPLDGSRGTTSASGWESGISSEGSRDGKSGGTGIFPFQIPPAPYPCSQPPAIPKVADPTRAFPRFPFPNLPCSTGIQESRAGNAQGWIWGLRTPCAPSRRALPVRLLNPK